MYQDTNRRRSQNLPEGLSLPNRRRDSSAPPGAQKEAAGFEGKARCGLRALGLGFRWLQRFGNQGFRAAGTTIAGLGNVVLRFRTRLMLCLSSRVLACGT